MIRYIFVFLLLASLGASEFLPNLKTGSMPCFQEQDRIFLDRDYPFKSLKLGDVICFRPTDRELERLATFQSPQVKRYMDFFENRGAMMCHRVSYIGADFVIVKPDVRETADAFRIGTWSYKGKIRAEKCEVG